MFSTRTLVTFPSHKAMEIGEVTRLRARRGAQRVRRLVA